jgi:cysteine desulfurase family protein (TIGR01976 family)
VDAIRAQFPALERLHRGRPVAYFDGPGGTQVPRSVVEACRDYLYHHNANTHWAYPTSLETDALLGRARHAMAELLGCGKEEIAFGANMTTLTFHLARSLGRSFAPGDEIIVTDLDHHANIDPWLDMARERGLTARAVPFDPADGRLDGEEFLRLLGPRTRLVALGAASNALGTVTDLLPLVAAARQAGALVFVDAVHAAPHLELDVRQLGCDFLACSAYKFYGPHIGILYARGGLPSGLDVPRLRPAAGAGAERLETGTLNHEGIVGAGAAVDFLAELSTGASRRERLAATMATLHQRGEALVGRLWEGLDAIDGVRLWGPPPGLPRTATIGFTVADLGSRTVAERLAEEAVFVSDGDFYATTVVERLGVATQGLVRAGCACYTTGDEVERLIEGVRRIAARR